MSKAQKDEYGEQEARERFEKAVDAALRTAPMHRAPKEAAKAKPKAKQAKSKR